MLYQRVQVIHHLVEGFGQFPHFIPAIHFNLFNRQIAGGDQLHILEHEPEWRGNHSRDDKPDA